MAQQTINIGAAPNDGAGDPIRDAFDKCNDNFTELYAGNPELIRDTIAAALVAGSNITITPNDGADTITIAASGSAGPSIQSVTSSATVTPTFADDQVNITAQAAGLTLANPSGTAVDAHGISIRIKDNGTARSITFGTQYRAVGVTLPTTTVISKTLYLGCVWNAADTKLDVVAVAQEA